MIKALIENYQEEEADHPNVNEEYYRKIDRRREEYRKILGIPIIGER